MTLTTLLPRDIIAIEAMKALLTEPQWDGEERASIAYIFENDDPSIPAQEVIAVSAYALADAMIAARGGGE